MGVGSKCIKKLHDTAQVNNSLVHSNELQSVLTLGHHHCCCGMLRVTSYIGLEGPTSPAAQLLDYTRRDPHLGCCSCCPNVKTMSVELVRVQTQLAKVDP